MNIDRLKSLLDGYELPHDPAEDMLLLVYTSAMMGNSLFDIYLRVAPDLSDNEELSAMVIVGYALAEKQIASHGLILEGDIQ